MSHDNSQPLDTLMASTIRVLALAIHDNDPNQLLTARRLLQTLAQHPALGAGAVNVAVNRAQEMLTDHLARCLHGAGGSERCH